MQSTLTQKEINGRIKEELQNHAIKLYSKGIEKLADRFFALENNNAKPLGWMKSAACFFGISVNGMLKLEADILAEWIDLYTVKDLKEQVKKGFLIVKEKMINGVLSLVYCATETTEEVETQTDKKDLYITCDKPIPCPDTIPTEAKRSPFGMTVKIKSRSFFKADERSPNWKPQSSLKETLQIGSFCAVTAGIAAGAILFLEPFFSLTGQPLFSSMFDAIPFPLAIVTAGIFGLLSKKL